MSRRVATGKLATTVLKMKRLIKKELDPLMEPFRTSNPDAFALYQAARLTINVPGSPSNPASAALEAVEAPAKVTT